MKWLNIEIATLRSPFYIGAEPVERATWLSLLGYCADQENGGRIVDCKRWKDRQWQQVCGITASEAALQSTLWTWEERDIVVTFYPADKEEELRAKRAAGTRGGKASGKVRKEAQLEAELGAQLEADLERKGKGKGNEKKSNAAPQLTLGIAEVSQQPQGKTKRSPQRIDEEFLVELINDPAFEGLDVRREHAKMERWCSLHKKPATARRLIAWLNRAEIPSKPLTEPSSAVSEAIRPWEAKQKAEAIKRRIESIKSDYANKVPNEEGFGYVLKPEAKAEVLALRAKLKDLDRMMTE